MNPSYCRIRLPQSLAIDRFAAWQEIAEIGPLVPSDLTRAVPLACDVNGHWLGHAVLVSEIGDWTLFSDLTGVLGGISAERWRAFAGDDELIFAGYNDAIPYGEFLMVRGGRVIREFLDDAQNPRANIDIGATDLSEVPLRTWIDVAGFVDHDILGFCESGLLWVWSC